MRYIAVVLLWVTAVHAQGGGYRLTADQLVIDRAAHWRAWEFPVGTLMIDQSGTVTPFALRRNTDATKDIVHFLRLHPPEDLAREKATRGNRARGCHRSGFQRAGCAPCARRRLGDLLGA